MSDIPIEHGMPKIGYQNPPEHTRFKPGKSGNPKGRPKEKAFDAATIVDVLNEPVVVRRKGRVSKMPGFEASARSLLARAVKGNLDAALMFIRLCAKHKAITPEMTKVIGGGVLIVPKSWSLEEFMQKLKLDGPPPWEGSRSGLPERSD